MISDCTSANPCENITNSSWVHGKEGQNEVVGGFLVTAAVAICAINGTVLLLLLLKTQLRTAANYLLMSLAISDLSTGLLVIPMGLVQEKLYFDASQEGDRHFFNVQATYHVLEKFIAFSTVFHVTAITIERYLAVKYPLKHYLLTESTVRRLIIAIWITALGISSIQFSWNLFEPTNEDESVEQYAHERNYLVLCIVSIFLLPYTLMLYAYYNMFRKIFDTKRSQSQRGALRRHSTCRKKNEHKPVIIFLSMAIIFAVCWLPWFTTTLYYLCGGTLHPDMHKTATLIRFLTPLTNPLLYTVFKRDFNQTLRSSLRSRVVRPRLMRRSKADTASVVISNRRSHHAECDSYPLEVVPSASNRSEQMNGEISEILLVENSAVTQKMGTPGKTDIALNPVVSDVAM